MNLGFMGKTLLASMGVTMLLNLFMTSQVSRHPSSVGKPLELHLQTLSLESTSRLNNLEGVYLRSTFNKQVVMEFGKGEKWEIGLGQTKSLDIRIDVDPDWILKDQLEFKVELVQEGLFESVLVRCSTISKAVSTYNRSYHCTIPGETTPFLTYRLATKGSPIPGAPSMTRTAKKK